MEAGLASPSSLRGVAGLVRVVSGKRYVGPCWELMRMADGTYRVTKLYIYWVSGERRYALTEAQALAAVATPVHVA